MINIHFKFAEGMNLPAGIFSGVYEDFSSMWYVDVGTQIMFAMILEIAAPHTIPFLYLFYY